MEYVLIDLEGGQHGTFDSRDELIADLERTSRASADLLRSLYVLTYDDDGTEIGEEARADEFLAVESTPSHAVLAYRLSVASQLIELSASANYALTAGTAPSHGFRELTPA
jgi:hypothetical protein